MKKKAEHDVLKGTELNIPVKEYKEALHALQVELVKLQRHFIQCNDKILVILEGRDTAGKDGTIKRVVQHLSPRETRIVALGRPSDRDRSTWYFQRYIPHLPAAQEFVLFNRSWYNRAGVERVMSFCSEPEYDEFMETVPDFEHMLVRSGIKLFKYYLDISKKEQKKRLQDRRKDPLKQWKVSPIDAEALKHWSDYSHARNEMFARTHSLTAPWTVVRADNKLLARLNLIKDLLMRLHYEGKNRDLVLPNPEIVFAYDDAHLKSGMLAK
ncbi:MAG: polyphosphate kinase 2 [Aromatoleum sp.]|jgi:polyphosphate kinase 2|uniref:polyphosphate kinase 2 n=1 Tax=Aromatoleum sp. TaxID=2307007 RepID=UPI002895BB6C|nr:polyphosphate kinase 2 [Aromatoleum sp.]MDT3672140.1 polyphosphate kinase 2 [Aromatoleum sp.]